LCTVSWWCIRYAELLQHLHGDWAQTYWGVKQCGFKPTKLKMYLIYCGNGTVFFKLRIVIYTQTHILLWAG
jgi:hypothetical protein